jgi:hypothetical protein
VQPEQQQQQQQQAPAPQQPSVPMLQPSPPRLVVSRPS